MKIYLDILFIENFIINLFIFEITRVLLHKKTELLREVLASTVVSSYSIFIIIRNYMFATSIACKLVVSTVIVLILYSPKDIAEYIKNTIMLYTATYFLGGVISSIINEISNYNIAIVISILICASFITLSIKIIKNKIRKSSYSCSTLISVNDKSIIINTLIDTGHNLNDQITGDTVIIVNENKIEELSQELYDILKGIRINIPEDYQTKIRMVSYNSLGNNSDVLCGIKADEVIVYYDGMTIESKSVIVAMSNTEIKEYDGLISMNLIEGGNIIGNSSIVKVESKKNMV